VGFFSGDFERYVKKALDKGLREICREGSGDGASFSM
jgi:hypothetical protein